MRVITGARYSGKLEYVKEVLKAAPSDILDLDEGTAGELAERMQDHPVLYHLEAFIRKALASGLDHDPIIDAYIARNPDCIIVCDEVGAGVIPCDESEEEWREAVGRLMCRLASHAGGVTRVVCGIPEDLTYGL